MEDTMRNNRIIKGSLRFLILLTCCLPAFAGDVLGGKVTEVRSAEIIIVDYGRGQYIVRIVGIAVPPEGPIAIEAKQAVTTMLLGKTMYARFQGRNKNGEMVSRVFIGDPGKDVGLELVRSGLARRQQAPDYQFDYKYGELTKAENEARENKRGLWATAQPR
jgi:endonuclease YncB( thermonuclease family)